MSELSVMNAMLYASANAGGFVTLAKDALGAAQEAVAKVGYDNVEWDSLGTPISPEVGSVPQAPALVPPTLDLPADVGPAPQLTAPAPIVAGPEPVNLAVAPVLNFPSVPAGLGNAPTAPAINTSFVFPEPPAELSTALPAAPVFADRREPTAPEIVLPSFQAQMPESVDNAPTDGERLMGESYRAQSQAMQDNAKRYVREWIDENSPQHHAQMERLESQLSRYLDGGTGLRPEVETAIYDRAREKNDAEARRVRDAAYSEAANRGFTLPSGALMAGIARARQEAANNNLKAASDIVVMQAEMEQKNLQFAVTTSAALRGAMVSAALSYMQNTISINGQAIDYAKSVFANVVELYNASVRVFSARVDAYKGYASVYEVQMKAALARNEVYRAEIAALEAMTNVDRSRVDIYRARIDASTSLIGLYKAQIEAVMGKVAMEKTKLEVFQVQAQAFGAQVQAKNAEWSGYSARLSGEESKVRIYSSQLSAYNSELDAFKTRLSARIAESEAVTRNNQASASLYGSTVQTYTARVNAEEARSRAANDNNRMVLTAYDKEMSSFMATVQLGLARYKAENDARVQGATSNLSAQVETARAKTQFGTTLAQLSNDGAKIYGSLAGAAMAGINTLAADVNNG